MTIFVIILGFLVGLVVSHHYVVKPLWETETKLRQELKKLWGELGTGSELRKEIKQLRANLYLAKHGNPVDQKFYKIWADVMNQGFFFGVDTPEGKNGSSLTEDQLKRAIKTITKNPTIPHRAHSDVLRINSIDDLIRGTRP